MQQTNLDIYGSEPIPWSRALDQLQAGSGAPRNFPFRLRCRLASSTYW